MNTMIVDTKVNRSKFKKVGIILIYITKYRRK